MTFDTWSYNFLFVTQQRIILDIDEHIVFDSDGEQRRWPSNYNCVGCKQRLVYLSLVWTAALLFYDLYLIT